jgi:hypothetical protein
MQHSVAFITAPLTTPLHTTRLWTLATCVHVPRAPRKHVHHQNVLKAPTKMRGRKMLCASFVTNLATSNQIVAHIVLSKANRAINPINPRNSMVGPIWRSRFLN